MSRKSRQGQPDEVARAEDMRAFAQGFADRVTPDDKPEPK